jgi:hypothetical protein
MLAESYIQQKLNINETDKVLTAARLQSMR